MRHRGNTGNIYVLFLFMSSIGLAVGGCPTSPGSSQGVQTETNAGSGTVENGTKAVSQANGESKTPSGSTELIQEEEGCGSCHKEQAKFRAYGGHSAVSCKTCHGVQENHIKAGTKPLMRGNDQCIECHALVEGSKAQKMSEKEILEHHLKFVEKKHVIKVKRKKVKGRCVYCHDPHLGQ